MALKKASLACTVCGSRNYSIKLSSTPKPKRLEVNKYCKHCSKYTIHKDGIYSFLCRHYLSFRLTCHKRFGTIVKYLLIFSLLVVLSSRLLL